MKKIKRVLISLSNKNNLKFLLRNLKKFKVELISSGGTHKEIKKLGFKCEEVSKYTNSPEILSGRVKTLHPKIHAGILSERKLKSHKNDLKKNNYSEIDLVIVNFYPFENILLNKSNHNKIIENIDIGGPTLVRAAAKNYNDVVVICNPNQYENLIAEINKNKGATSLDFREKLAEDAFMETAYYESKIFNYFNQKSGNIFPIKNVFSGKIVEKTRYGENPHQKGAIYKENNWNDIKQLSGKQMSYNNYNDLYSALNIAKFLPNNKGVVIVKHANPCGVSANSSKIKSFKEALECDPISAYGGIIKCNFKLNANTAREISKIFFEIIIANGFDKKSLTILKKRKNLRIIDSSNLKEKKVDFVIEPYLRFKGLAGEQMTMFLYDPAGNALEFKSFKSDDEIFKST